MVEIPFNHLNMAKCCVENLFEINKKYRVEHQRMINDIELSFVSADVQINESFPDEDF